MYEHILVPIDGSDAAALGLREAIELARQLKARIRLIHVINKTPLISPGVTAGMIEDVVAQLRKDGESIVRDAKALVRLADIEVDERLVDAIGERTGESVVAEAREWPAQLIVCGTHGRRGLRRLVMGSDAEYIVRHSHIPVLLVRARGA
jgi:nucleotide-binding universal stress UspA family protein